MPAQRKPAAVRPRIGKRKKVPAENRAIRPIFSHQNVNTGKNRSIIPIYPRQNIKTQKIGVFALFSLRKAQLSVKIGRIPLFSPPRRCTPGGRHACASMRRSPSAAQAVRFGRAAKTSIHSRGCPRPCALVPSIRRQAGCAQRRPRRRRTGGAKAPFLLMRPGCTSPLSPPPQRQRAPGVGHLFWRLPPVGRQYSGVGRPIFSR